VSRSALEAGTATWTVAYSVPVSGEGAPYAMGREDVGAWAQSDLPTDAAAIFPPDQVPTQPVSSYARATVHYLNRDGYQVNTAAPGGHITTAEYDVYGNVRRELTAANRARALADGDSSARARELDTQRRFEADGLRMVEQIGPLHHVELPDGERVAARQRTRTTYDEGAPSGGPYHLPTTTTVGAMVRGRDTDADVRTTKTAYDWKWRTATTTTRDARSGGLNLIDRTILDSATGLGLERRMPSKPDGGDASTTRTTYYTAAANSTHPECGNRPEWHNLPCRIAPAAQPNTPGLPDLPTTTYRYHRLGLPTTTTETIGSNTRTTTTSYDAAGRERTKEVTASQGTPLPSTTTAYEQATGRPTTLTADGKTITTRYDRLGRVTSYTDASNNTATTSYDLLSRPTVTTDGKGSQTRTYDPQSGLLVRLEDSAAGVFSAAYDPDGQMVDHGLPNGLHARTTYDPTGAPTHLAYDKLSDCTENCRWLDFSVTESIHGQWVAHDGTLSDQRYAYDPIGRLTGVQDTPTGHGCTTRSYAFDANSNRTRKTTRAPGSNGACDTTSAGSVGSTTTTPPTA